jgi:hypothetical protein
VHQIRRLLVFPIVLGLVLGFVAIHGAAPSASAQAQVVASPNCAAQGPGTYVCTDVLGAPVQAGSSVQISVQGTGGGTIVSCSGPNGVPCQVSSDGSGAVLVCASGCQPGQQVTVTFQGPSSPQQYFTIVAGAPYAAGSGPAGYNAPYPAPSSSYGPAYSATLSSPPVGAITVGNSTPAVSVTVSSGQPGYASQPAYSPPPPAGQCVAGSYPTVYGCTSGYVPVLVPVGGYGSCGYYWGGCGYYGGGCYGIYWGCGYNTCNNWWGGSWWGGCGYNGGFCSWWCGANFGGFANYGHHDGDHHWNGGWNGGNWWNGNGGTSLYNCIGGNGGAGGNGGNGGTGAGSPGGAGGAGGAGGVGCIVTGGGGFAPFRHR